MSLIPTAVVLDWAGTTVDHGSCGPAEVFRAIFAARGVEITNDEARGPMGRAKRDHIATIAADPRVATAWGEQHGSDCSNADIDAMYADFLPLQKQVLSRSSDVIPGVAAAVAELRGLGAAIGSSTGYTRELMEVVEPIAARQGYAPDCTCTADEVAAGRPEPLLNQLAASRLGVALGPQVVVVDDTLVGIEAGLRSGCTTVGVSRTGNLMGLTLAETEALTDDDLQARLALITATLLEAGAHYVIESVADLPELLRQI
jgi:phosphonoacetaldehyde hydrolase